MKTFKEFILSENFKEVGKSFLLSPTGRFVWDIEHYFAANREFNILKKDKYNFIEMIVPTGKNLQKITFLEFLKQRGYVWGRYNKSNNTIMLFSAPKPTERQIKAVEDYALEHDMESNIDSFAARKIKFIS